jgi:hypothetical protein
MQEYLHFKKMITPSVIQVLFWIAVVAVVISGLAEMDNSVLGGLAIVILGPLAVRVYAEMLMVLFQISNTLSEIKTELTKTKK